jgi:hypothetical protein
LRIKADKEGGEVFLDMRELKIVFQGRGSGPGLQLNFDKRDSLKQEEGFEREISCAFCLVSQAECATFCGIVL